MAWLSGYQYRKQITIAGSSGAGNGYQVLLKIGESAGSSGADFHLEGHALSFPNDIRFTGPDGITEYSYWIESIEGTSPNRLINVWVKIDDSLDTNTDIYVYYGKSGDTSASNGNTTFELFDDFEGPSVDTNKWDVQPGNGTIEITTIDEVSALHIGNYMNYYSYIQAKNGINPTGKVAVMRTRIGNYGGEFWGFGHAWKDAFDTSTKSVLKHRTTQSGSSGGTPPYDQCVERVVNNNLDARTNPLRTAINPLPADVWSIWTLRIDSPSSAYAKSVIESTGTVINEDILSWTTPLPSTTYYAVGKYFANSNYTTAGSWGNHYVDYVYIRKYADPEPSFSAVGAEETSTPSGTPISLSIGQLFAISGLVSQRIAFATTLAKLFNYLHATETGITRQVLKNTSIAQEISKKHFLTVSAVQDIRKDLQKYLGALNEIAILITKQAGVETQIKSAVMTSASVINNLVLLIDDLISLNNDIGKLEQQKLITDIEIKKVIQEKMGTYEEFLSVVLLGFASVSESIHKIDVRSGVKSDIIKLVLEQQKLITDIEIKKVIQEKMGTYEEFLSVVLLGFASVSESIHKIDVRSGVKSDIIKLVLVDLVDLIENIVLNVVSADSEIGINKEIKKEFSNILNVILYLEQLLIQLRTMYDKTGVQVLVDKIGRLKTLIKDLIPPEGGK